jgi:murein DD-endopeptidase MepM/ murein hydrolase activator NlpD
VGTVIDANPSIKKESIHVGEILQVLPTSGVVYNSVSGDTLASIASQFNISQEKITKLNQSIDFSTLSVGTPIIIPGGLESNLVAAQKSALPNFNKEFIMPAEGYDWGILHNYNAVDIANSCGTPVVAAADGLVVRDENIPDVLGGWNDGYGNFVLIEHAFGNDIRTRYAHLASISVQVGDYVKQGQQIGLMGESGEATGCHVHFEVLGAQNPFVK